MSFILYPLLIMSIVTLAQLFIIIIFYGINNPGEIYNRAWDTRNEENYNLKLISCKNRLD